MAVLGGCRQAQQASPALPAVRLESSSVLGALLETTPATSPTTGPALRVGTVGVEVTWVAVARLPADLLEPLDARATLVSAPLAGGPVLTSGRQTAAARFGDGDVVEQLFQRLIARTDGLVAQVGHQVGVVVPGSTTTFRLSAAAEVKRPGRSVAISLNLPPIENSPVTQPVSRPASQATTVPTAVGDITVALEGFRDAVDIDEDAPATRPSIVTTPETAYLAGLPLSPGRRFALMLPSRFDTSPWRGIVAFIDVVDPPADATDLADAQFGRPSATQPATQPAVERTLMRAVDALRTTVDPRASLLYLATATRATIAADTILIAERPLLDRLRSELLQYTKEHAAADAAALGWHLDRSAVLVLCDLQQANTLAPELATVLTVHGGEVGRHADAMADAAKSVGSAADLKARLVGENTIALEDNAPAARVRAFDWLKGQGRAPEGYDPLADARARRAAINQSISTTQGTR